MGLYASKELFKSGRLGNCVPVTESELLCFHTFNIIVTHSVKLSLTGYYMHTVVNHCTESRIVICIL